MAGPLDELVGGLDPVDVATLFGRFKSAVPLGMAAFSRGLNEGEDEALLKKYGTRPLPPMVQPDAQEMQRRAIEEFELRYPTPELREAILAQMRANRRGDAYDPSTATRRIDFAPQNQPDYKGPVATPSTGKRRFQAGGGVKKTVQHMKDELMLGGKSKPVKETVDLSRRSFFRLPESKSFPLAKIDDTALDKLEQKYAKQGQAPTITEKKVELSPDAGKTKSTLQSLTETPMSRRLVLQAAAGQTLRGALPGVGDVVPGVGDVAKIVESVATPGLAATKANIPGLVAMAMKQGMNADEAVAFVMSQFSKPPKFGGIMAKGEDPAEYFAQHIEDLHNRFEEPFVNYNPDITGAVRPGKAFQEMIGREEERIKPLALKPVMRGLQQADPDKYRELIQAAKNRSMASVETLLSYPDIDPDVVQSYMRGELRSLPPSYRDKLGYDE
jgi:hypothetical protein